ncbi:MAG: gliding motility-associated C-terminal domain-containing protein [Bacteroidota bacterium]
MSCRKISISLILLLLSVVALSQDTITSIANGNWISPFTWDCVPFPCIPETTDVVIVDHAVILNTDWAISTGSITVNPGASLIEDISGRIFYQFGGTFLNNGTVDISNIASTGGTFTNNDSLRINTAFYNTINFINNGIIADVDSFLNTGSFTNNYLANLNISDFWNTGSCSNNGTILMTNCENDGDFTNDGIIAEVDSFANFGVFTNNANAELNTSNFWTTDTCSNSGTIHVTNYVNDKNFTNDGMLVFVNFYNTGSFQNYAGGKISAYDFWNAGSFQIDSNSTFNTSHDFLNGDTLFPTYDAVFINNGFAGVGNDWYNSDTIKGTTGQFCIKNYTYNLGWMKGSFDFCDKTLMALPDSVDINTGTVENNITFCSSPCNMVASITTKKISCFGICDGQAVVSPYGGTPPYSFLWSTGLITDSISGLCTGIYQVTVIDATPDTILASILITGPSVIVLTTSSTQATCGYANGTASANVSGGTPGYSYLWDDPTSQTNSTATGLAAGIYYVSVTDNNTCNATDSITITEPPELISIITIINVSCPGIASGTASVSVSGGTPGYTYSWDDPFNQTNSTATWLAAGTYSVSVTDNNNCSTTDPVTITESPELVSVISIIDASCPDIADGSAVVSVSGGVPPYTYVWDPPVDGGDGSDAENLIEGIYLITVTDSNNCIKTDSAVINVIGGDDCKEEWYIYSGITPNDDGIDDTWVIKGLEQYKPVSLIIFNRWGDVVYESDNYNNNWDGTNQEGKPIPDGVYYFAIKRNDKTIKGWVSVIR